MERGKGYKFTNKKHPEKGIMSSVLGMISLVSVGVSIYLTYLAKGQASANMGVVGFMVMIFAVAGIVLGYISKNESDRFMLFPYLGLFLNVIALICISIILYAGAYGI